MPEGEGRQYDHVILWKLGTAEQPPESILDDLGLAGVIEAVEWCYEVRGIGHWVLPDEVQWDPYSRWLRAAFGLAGSIGESLLVCVGCEVEVELLRRSNNPAAEIGGRFFSIASSNELIGIGHRLVNLTQRAASARSDYRAMLKASPDGKLKACAAIDDPRSSERSAWLSLNKATVKALADATEPIPHRSIHSAVDGLKRLADSEEWRTLDETRGEVFHRSRPESSINFGVDANSGHHTPMRRDDGAAIGYSVGEPVRYAGGDDRWESEADAIATALHRVAEASVEVTSAILDAVEPLTKGSRSVDRDGNRAVAHEHFGRQWDETHCRCCAS